MSCFGNQQVQVNWRLCLIKDGQVATVILYLTKRSCSRLDSENKKRFRISLRQAQAFRKPFLVIIELLRLGECSMLVHQLVPRNQEM